MRVLWEWVEKASRFESGKHTADLLRVMWVVPSDFCHLFKFEPLSR